MYWYGVDLHTTNFTVAQLNEQENVKIFKFYLNEGEIERFKKMLTKDDKVAFEVSTNAFWFYDKIKDNVSECIVVNPKKFKVICESTSKTDKKDAKLIVRFLKYNLLPAVYVPEKNMRELRGLFSSYHFETRIKVMTRNRIHGLLKKEGIKVKRSEVNQGLLFNLCMQKRHLSEINHRQIKLQLEQLDFIEKKIKKIKEEIYLLGETYKESINILISERGIDVFMALAIISDIVDINRFDNPRKLASYLGLAPKVDSSNGTTHLGKVHKQSRKLTKTMLVQSIRHFREASKYYDKFYEKKKKGKSIGKVKIAIARKKVVGIYYMLKRKQYSIYREEELHKQKIARYENTLKKLKQQREEEKELIKKAS